MTLEEKKNFIMKAMNNARGDDLERATAAFRNCTAAQMDEEYGQSGDTRKQILKEYETHRQRWNEVNAWLSDVFKNLTD